MRDIHTSPEVVKQGTIFDDYIEPRSRRKSRSYAAFVDKFKPKLTTDDCYTPPAVYDVVLDWVRDNCDIEGCRILRPFRPAGDYESEVYAENDVVIDNPPFSIITPIVKFYVERNIRFFLFAPHLTAFHYGRHCSTVITNSDITYENGAKVKTAVVTNMLGDVAIMTAPRLRQQIKDVQKSNVAALPKYKYPDNVVSAALLGKIADFDFVARKNEVQYIQRLRAQDNRGIFGGGYLLSTFLATSWMAAQAQAQALALKSDNVIAFELSDTEREIIKMLDNNAASKKNE